MEYITMKPIVVNGVEIGSGDRRRSDLLAILKMLATLTPYECQMIHSVWGAKWTQYTVTLVCDATSDALIKKIDRGFRIAPHGGVSIFWQNYPEADERYVEIENWDDLKPWIPRAWPMRIIWAAGEPTEIVRQTELASALDAARASWSA